MKLERDCFAHTRSKGFQIRFVHMLASMPRCNSNIQASRTHDMNKLVVGTDDLSFVWICRKYVSSSQNARTSSLSNKAYIIKTSRPGTWVSSDRTSSYRSPWCYWESKRVYEEYTQRRGPKYSPRGRSYCETVYVLPSLT